MATCSKTGPNGPSSYLSPARVLARAFEKSRDRWKAKYKVLQERVKGFRTEVRDLRRSRQRWRARAEKLERQLDELRAQAQQPTESPPAPSRPSPHFATQHSS
jgi:septal ring factor EnvC (AmiA/AmiB activator)